MTGVSVAVVDSGANVPHPHLPDVAGGVSFDLEGGMGEGFVDRIGHGTAATAAIHEKAPAATLYAVKVFHDQLATSVPTLVRAIDWATDRGVRLVNLSLGTPNAFREEELEPAVRRAIDAGTVIVSASWHEGRDWYPGCMDGVVGVVMDPAQPREQVRVSARDGRRELIASCYPRPIPGVPPERNFNGISFAVANATGIIAELLERNPDARTENEILDLLE